MKQTIKTSRVAGQHEKMFRALNSRFFDGELPEVVISLKKTAGAYGHFTTGKVWKTGGERRYEINISSASLNQECAFLAGVLVHEMVHEYCAEHGIKDTSNNGVYHNKNFKHIAETHGLEVEHTPITETACKMISHPTGCYLHDKENENGVLFAILFISCHTSL